MAGLSDFEDFYAILEVPRTADPATIKAAYRRLALLCHPDKSNAPGATADFQRLGRAWEVLGDETKKAAYDYRWRNASTSNSASQKASTQAARAQSRRRKKEEEKRRAEEEKKRKAKVEEELEKAAAETVATEWRTFRELQNKQTPRFRIFHIKNGALYTVWLRNFKIFQKEHRILSESIAELSAMREELDETVGGTETLLVRLTSMKALSADSSWTQDSILRLETTIRASVQPLRQTRRRLFGMIAARVAERKGRELAFEEEERIFRRSSAAEVLDIMEMPADGLQFCNPEIINIIKRRLNFWTSLAQMQFLTGFWTVDTEGAHKEPWHVEHEFQPWIHKLNTDGFGSRLCAKCNLDFYGELNSGEWIGADQQSLLPWKCPKCPMVICRRCLKDLLLVQQYTEWLKNTYTCILHPREDRLPPPL